MSERNFTRIVVATLYAGALCRAAGINPDSQLGLLNSDKAWERYVESARIAIRTMRELPKAISADPYWALNHFQGSTGMNPVPSLRAAIEAYIDEVLK